MSELDLRFSELRARGEKAFLPFITAGDPDLATTAEVLGLLARHGATFAEVGFPYSDPIADGPVIQASYTRALAHGIHVDRIMETLREYRRQAASIPIVSMVSYAIVLRHGLQAFVKLAAESRVAGLIVPDLPIEESTALAALCQSADMSLVQLVTPTTPRDRAIRIAQVSTGFLYYVSVAGITGERRELPPSVIEQVGWLREQTPLPICIGFGISTPEHVRMLEPVADGVIVGSALVRQLTRLDSEPRDQVLRDLGILVDALRAPLRSTG